MPLRKTQNVRICKFYEDHPSISFEEVNLAFIDLFEKILCSAGQKITAASVEQTFETIMSDYGVASNNISYELPTSKLSSPSNSPSLVELERDITDSVLHSYKVGKILNKTFDTADITVNKNGPTTMLSYTMIRESKPTIVFVSSDNERNVNKQEIQDFTKYIELQKCYGIFLSQCAGFTAKPNYHIEMCNGKLLVYVHNVDYNCEKIQIAVDIIDNLSIKINDLTKDTSNGTISIEILNEINREYQLFVEHKENIVNMMKESSKSLIHQLDELKFSCLDKYLSTKFNTIKKIGSKCELCKVFIATNLKAMAAHRRGCNRKKLPVFTSPLENITLDNALSLENILVI